MRRGIPVDKLNEQRWIRMLRRDGVQVDKRHRSILISGDLHPIHTERIQQLKLRNQFKIHQQLRLF